MKIAIVSGKDEGPTRLNAFDNALTAAGIGDVNLIKVSSMLGKNTQVKDLPKLKPGAIGEKLGCVVETTGTNKDPQD